ncbi:hypothetical protein D5F01_LYC22922 [Larimichthys crocea]|uniref:Uncharacterized protein n=1 Tax=Larimichthys crocea TaxID=215358 RepID=A0A6G0HJG6_LARCR|nr:hypothetical protein D5F01_LYC22922 [Larimichthys crocea]
MLTLRLLHKCNTVQSRTRSSGAAHMKTLVSQTMEGLTVTGNFSADGKDMKKVCKAVQKDLQKRYGSKGLVQTVILQEDAAVDADIAQCLQTHTRAFIAEQGKERSSSGGVSYVMSHILEPLIWTFSISTPTLLQKTHQIQGSQRRKDDSYGYNELPDEHHRACSCFCFWLRVSNRDRRSKQLRLFVTVLTVRLLHKCNTVQSRTQEQWVAHMKTLVSQTMEGLTVTGNFSADSKDIKKVCKAVQKDLQKRYGSKGLVQTVILQEDAAVDADIAQCLQTHTRAFIAEQGKKRSWWSSRDLLDFLRGVTCILVFLGVFMFLGYLLM